MPCDIEQFHGSCHSDHNLALLGFGLALTFCSVAFGLLVVLLLPVSNDLIVDIFELIRPFDSFI